MNSNDYDFHDPRSSKYWTHTGDVTTGVYNPAGGGRESQGFRRAIGMETAHVSGALTGSHASSVPINHLVSRYNMPQAYGPDEVQTQVSFLGEEAVKEYNNRMSRTWDDVVKSPEFKSLDRDAQNLRLIQAERSVQRGLVDEGKAVEYELDLYGNHTGRYRAGKVIAASDGWFREEGRKFTNLNATGKGDPEFEKGRARLLASNSFEERHQPTQGMFTPINTQGLSGPRGEQVVSAGSFRFNPDRQAVGVGPNDYYGGDSRGNNGGGGPRGNAAPFVNPAYAAKFQEIISSRVQPGDLREMAASARANNAAHAGQNVPYFGDDNEAGRAYLNK